MASKVFNVDGDKHIVEKPEKCSMIYYDTYVDQT